MSLRQQAVAGVRWTAIDTVCGVVLTYVRIFVLARLLDPKDFGMMAIVQVVIGLLLAFADLGISAAIVQRQNATRDELSTLYWLSMAVGWGAFVLLAAASPLVATLYREPRLTPLLMVTAVSFLLVPVGAQFQFLLMRDLRFATLAVLGIGTEVVRTAVAVVLALTGAGVWALVWAQLSGTLVANLCLLALGLRDFRPKLHFKREDLRGYVRFGLLEMGSRAAGFTHQRIDQLLLGLFLGMESLGYYNFAFNWASQVRDRLNPVLTKVSFPVFAKVQNDEARLQRGYLKVSNFTMMVNAPLLIGLAALAPPWIPRLFGDKWIPSVPILQVLALVMVVRCVLPLVPAVALARGRPEKSLSLALLLLACYSGAVCVGAARGGAFAVTAALMAADLLLVVPVYRLFVRPLIGACAPAYARAVTKPVSAAMLMGLAVYAVCERVGASVPWLLGMIIAGGGLYIVLLLTLQRELLLEVRDLCAGLLNWPRAARTDMG